MNWTTARIWNSVGIYNDWATSSKQGRLSVLHSVTVRKTNKELQRQKNWQRRRTSVQLSGVPSSKKTLAASPLPSSFWRESNGESHAYKLEKRRQEEDPKSREKILPSFPLPLFVASYRQQGAKRSEEDPAGLFFFFLQRFSAISAALSQCGQRRESRRELDQWHRSAAEK